MSYRLGIIGSGAIGGMHADAAAKVGTTVAGFCDLDLSRAQHLASMYDGSIACDSIEAFVARDDIDAVVIAVPNFLHRDLAVTALEAGKDVLLEKPMAMSVAECDEIIAAKDRSGRIVQLGFVCRYAPAAQAAREFVESGDLGTIYHAKAQLYRRRGIPGLGRWFTTRAQSGGGVLIDLGVHLVDLALHLLGGPAVERVSGHCTSIFGSPIGDYVFNEMWAGPPNPDGVFDVDDGAVGLVRLAGGATLEINTTWAANLPDGSLPNGVVLLGDRGGCIVDIWENTLKVATVQHGRITDWQPQLPPGDAWDLGWRAEHEAFAHAVTTREDPIASVHDGRRVQSVLDAMYRSSETGREVEVG